jgi:membrane protein
MPETPPTPRPSASVSRGGFRGYAQDVRLTLSRRGWNTCRYMVETEVHTYAFSVAANAILSFFPFVVLLMSLIKHVFRSEAMYDVVVRLLKDFLPAGQEFIVRNLNAMVNARRGVQVMSLIILLFTSTGIFLPLEVALNSIFGVEKNRSYLKNQLISLALAFMVGMLTLASVALTSMNQALLDAAFSGSLRRVLSYVVMKIFGIAASVTIFFLIYWLLPNAKIKKRIVFPAALITGLLWELGKYAYIAALPHLDFAEVYGPFNYSVTLMFWAFLSGLLLLAGAHLIGKEVEETKVETGD